MNDKIYNITPKEVFEILSNDKEILDIYKKIEVKELEEQMGAFHNYEHIMKVSKIAEKILSDLKFDDNTIYKCRIACLLHDVGALQGKEGHALRSYEYAKKLFDDKGLVFEDKEVILDAIKNHSAGFDSDNIINLAIILADKLDIRKTRIPKTSVLEKGNRQYAHFLDIEINIFDDELVINYITDGKVDMKELNDYYFTTKIFKAVSSFAGKLNIKHKLLMDGKEWVKGEQ